MFVCDRRLLQAARIVCIAARVLGLVYVLLSTLLYYSRATFLFCVFVLCVLYSSLLPLVLRILFVRNILQVTMA